VRQCKNGKNTFWKYILDFFFTFWKKIQFGKIHFGFFGFWAEKKELKKKFTIIFRHLLINKKIKRT